MDHARRGDAATVERRLFGFVNNYRAANGRSELQPAGAVIPAARAHATAMGLHAFDGATSPTGTTVSDRVGFPVGVTTARLPDDAAPAEIASAVLDAWKTSDAQTTVRGDQWDYTALGCYIGDNVNVAQVYFEAETAAIFTES